jgi:hypothetical protein
MDALCPRRSDRSGPSRGGSMFVSKLSKTSMPIAEMKEFATFASSTQRYIRRSLDVASGAEGALDKWARDDLEAASIRAQHSIYRRLDTVRGLIPDAPGILDCEPMISPIVTLAAFDLGQGRLPTFSSFRFLYERILGGRARPWLPSAFMFAAGMPHIHPSNRGSLLKSISEAAATASGWTSREPEFFPTWVEKVEMAA